MRYSRLEFKLTPDLKLPEEIRRPPQPQSVHESLSSTASLHDAEMKCHLLLLYRVLLYAALCCSMLSYAPICCSMQVQKCGGWASPLPGTAEIRSKLRIFENAVRRSETLKRGQAQEILRLVRLAAATNWTMVSGRIDALPVCCQVAGHRSW
ncbi:hypothetical protein EG329_010483 [Mollisiaceae sp. DMI_Dod_QoI]|nr:hypothetical protein EG329_010483 [Helotiales sp. DMI_Dod_QoI]